MEEEKTLAEKEWEIDFDYIVEEEKVFSSEDVKQHINSALKRCKKWDSYGDIYIPTNELIKIFKEEFGELLEW